MRRPWCLVAPGGELRAGWHDARRTVRPRVWHGRRYGDVFYAAGYAARVVFRGGAS